MAETRVSLIQRVRSNADELAWAEFFAIYRPLMIAYVCKRGVLEDDAADIVQDVFARLIPALANFEIDAQRGRFRTWLWQVTHNALVDWARRRATRDRAERGWIDQHEQASDGSSSAEWEELFHRRALEVAMERVRAVTQAVTWACFEGKILQARPAAEVAAETGLSTNAVYLNASRVLARIREELPAFEEPFASS